MKNTRTAIVMTGVWLIFFAFTTYAQGGGGIQPPPCCTKEDPPPPPPPGGDAISPATFETDLFPVVTLSDAALQTAGLTRRQVLDQLAATLPGGSSEPVMLIIPGFTLITAADGTVTYDAVFYTVEESQVSDDTLAQFNVFYLTDGASMIAVNFIQDLTR
jgi:hypothetical protein